MPMKKTCFRSFKEMTVFPGQRMLFRKGHHGFVMRDGLKLQALLRDRLVQADKAEVDPAIVQGAELIAAGHVEKIDRDGGEGALKGGERDRNEIVKQVGHVADVKRRRTVPAQLLHRFDDFLAQIEHPLGVAQESRPFPRETDLAAGAIQQADADLFFEILDLPGERRLGKVQLLRAFGKAERFRYGNKIA